MTIKPGTYTLGPTDGRLQIRTGREGLAQKVGHDLTLELSNWNATVTIDPEPAQSMVTAAIETRSMEVIAATGGVKAMTDKDKKDIKKNIAGLLGDQTITFQSKSVQPRSESAVTVVGDLSIGGYTRETTVDLSIQPDGTATRLTARVPVIQSSFGVKPFSAMLGALKVKDEVQVELEVRLSAE
jgi:polyisoprenoid-binding protein YceI